MEDHSTAENAPSLWPRGLDVTTDPVWTTARQSRIESGDASRARRADRIAVVASYGDVPNVSMSLAALCAELETCGYVTIVIRASDDERKLIWPSGTASPIVVRRRNRGYDFGSWAVAIEMFPRLRTAPHVLLVNDSMAGPFAALDVVLESFEKSFTPLWGLTSTDQYIPHLQSYFLGFRDGLLADPSIRKFWRGVRHEDDKARIIHRYELGLNRLMHSEAVPFSAFLPSELLVPSGANPTIWGWRRMLDLGAPVVKRELIRKPDIVPDGRQIPAEVLLRYGQRVAEWV